MQSKNLDKNKPWSETDISTLRNLLRQGAPSKRQPTYCIGE
jgi:hypothetical protein